MLKPLCKSLLVLALGMAGMFLPVPDRAGWPSGAALADDHLDDDDGAAGDDDDDDRVIRRPRPTIRPAPQPRAPRLRPPRRAPDEIVAPRLGADDFRSLLDQGFRLIEAHPRGDGSIARRLRIPPGSTLPAARAIVRGLQTGAQADFNHYYRTEETLIATAGAARPASACTGPHCADRRLIGWGYDPGRVAACTRDVTIGIVDTGLNEKHDAFGSARLEVIRLTPERLAPSEQTHGTAVAALLVGGPDSRAPGLVPGARVIAVDAFHDVRGDQRADAFTLIKALSRLADSGADVINLSLAGPANTALKQVIDRLAGEENIILVAAVGNAGSRAQPLFPAAYPPVIAVTAVDRDLKVYRRAVTGAHVDLAAPGVDVWTAASVSGVRPRSGTSFAVPFVTATLALLRGQQPQLSGADALAILTREARDLGDPGRDPVFGAGLVAAGALCPG